MTKTKRTQSIGKKLILMLVGISTLSALITGSVLFAYEWNSAEKDSRNNLTVISETLSPNLTAAILFEDMSTAHELIKPLLMRDSIVYSHVANNNGKVLARVGNEASFLDFNPEKYISVSSDLTYEDQSYGTLHIIEDRSYIDKKSQFYFFFITLVILLNVGICLGISIRLKEKFVAPILQLATLAKKVSHEGNYAIRANRYGDDEITELTDYFNHMLDTIEERDLYLESEVKDRTEEIEKVNFQLRRQAYTDSLTDLPNRHFFYESLRRTIKESFDHNLQFSLMFIDLDGFKEVNDTLGHDYGDLLLIEVSRRLQHCVRESDIVARLGGDEFTLIIKGLNSTDRINLIAEDILSNISKPYQVKDEPVYVSGSLGVALFPADGNNVEDLVKHADQAMYESKHSGRNCYRYFTEALQVDALKRKSMSDELRSAVENNNFELYYQPIVNLNNNTVVKAEALIRWRRNDGQLTPPEDFIPLAEDIGLINEMTDWVSKEALRSALEWRKYADVDFQVSINTSPSLYKGEPTWFDQWLSYLDAQSAPHQLISMEITEGLLMQSDTALKAQLIRLRDHGIEVSIDDFGVGYSSLSYLQKLDIDVLKIDKSFITDLTENSASLALCKAIIVMAHQLDLKVIAEGVETKQQHEILVTVGCDYGQGFFYSKPIPGELFMEKFVTKKLAHAPIIH
jgi:diguanylate cyclase (GGDEF)-like protein